MRLSTVTLVMAAVLAAPPVFGTEKDRTPAAGVPEEAPPGPVAEPEAVSATTDEALPPQDLDEQWKREIEEMRKKEGE